ncbi:hypothetical protein AKJ09_04851 [Labilithrix luteola]|uniref:Lipoprotein n=1 Tax=Labilithrix luteola TaxID=1391654 RepID=A0A0K1PXE4_9BACT|nr:hypothetical protein [Labilithrix luteola]AKU98187.1 hypothetical protein AKJ09_04851 [Labilithrix luteola]
MSRKPLAALLFFVGIPAATLLACSSNSGGGKSCTAIGCADGATLSAHLQMPVDAFGTLQVKACWNGYCGTGSVDQEKDAGSGEPLPTLFQLQGGSLYGTVHRVDEGSGWTRLDVSVRPAAETKDGDRYTLTVTDAQGAVLFDVERITTYSRSYPNGPDCDERACMNATHALYSESANGLACTGNTCDAGAIIRQSVAVDAALTEVNVVACRNDACWPTTVVGLPSGKGASSTRMTTPPGSIAVTRPAPDRADFEVRVQGETAALIDGDRYRLTVTDGRTQKVLANIDRQVTYEATFPNGQACDAHPCRIARIEGP